MIDAIGYLAGFLAMISFLPQVIKTLRTKKADDISVAMLVLMSVTNTLYVVYGLLLRLYPVMIMIGIMTCILIFQTLLTMKYRSRSQKDGI
jgi:MtN3 and saliva related transmembrane protein